ncbi:hypothetical protein [Nocardioides jensenii]|uniref:hypothetical protein n=1 Tax=Nocardioides jensenii TaxID=1843 RepID=UPI001C3F1678|nr:hypothetical protein [Nocardioides jensenii]
MNRKTEEWMGRGPDPEDAGADRWGSGDSSGSGDHWLGRAIRFRYSGKRRPGSTEARFAEGHVAVGLIDRAIEDSPGEVQGPDTLIIRAEAPGHGVIHRRVTCPLSMSGSGRSLVGHTIGFRHARLDPDDLDDVLVIRWPDEVRRALEPFRPEGPGALRARAWRVLAGCSAVVTVGGILLTVVMLIGVIFTAGEMFADLPAWFRPGVVLSGSAGAVVLGAFAFAVCESRTQAALSHPETGRLSPGERARRR